MVNVTLALTRSTRFPDVSRKSSDVVWLSNGRVVWKSFLVARRLFGGNRVLQKGMRHVCVFKRRVWGTSSLLNWLEAIASRLEAMGHCY